MKLIFKEIPVPGTSSFASASRIAALDHEPRDDAMEQRVIVCTRRAQRQEILLPRQRACYNTRHA